MHPFRMHRRKACLCKEAAPAELRGNAVVLAARVVTMESCALLQNIYEVMDGKYDSALALLGWGWISAVTGDAVSGPA